MDTHKVHVLEFHLNILTAEKYSLRSRPPRDEGIGLHSIPPFPDSAWAGFFGMMTTTTTTAEKYIMTGKLAS